MIQGQTVQPPSLSEVLNQFKQNIFSSMNVCKPGIIYSYDAVKCTAVVQVCFKKSFYDGSTTSYPLVSDCPVFTIQGGGVHAAFPIQKGDECLIFFADSNIDLWFQSGGQAVPFDGRQHSLSDAFVLVGINSLANKRITSLAATEGGISDGASKIAIDKSTHKITATDGTAKVEIDRATHTATLTDGVAKIVADGPTHKIAFENAVTSLLLTLTDLITKLKAITITDPQGGVGTVSVASQAQLDLVTTALNTLLK